MRSSRSSWGPIVGENSRVWNQRRYFFHDGTSRLGFAKHGGRYHGLSYSCLVQPPTIDITGWKCDDSIVVRCQSPRNTCLLLTQIPSQRGRLCHRSGAVPPRQDRFWLAWILGRHRLRSSEHVLHHGCDHAAGFWGGNGVHEDRLGRPRALGTNQRRSQDCLYSPGCSLV